MTTVTWLQDRASRRLHRDDFTEADYDDAFEAATAEIGQQLRSDENLVTLEVPGGYANPYTVPADLRAIREVWVAQQRGPLTLAPADQTKILKYQTAGVPVQFYNLIGRELWLAPNGTPDMTLVHWVEPELISVSGVQTNAVLAAWPNMYLYRVLSELCEITQDMELVAGYREAYLARVAEINRAASWGARGNRAARSRG